MAIIAFWSNEEKETGQTMSMVALSTYIAIEHNYRILNVSSNFKDETLENSYWDFSKKESLMKSISKGQGQVELESGIEGLVKIINSNKTTMNIVSNYAKIVFKDRLDVLCAPKVQDYEEYKKMAEFYPSILQLAGKSYDLVFVDVSRTMPKEQVKQILELSDIIVVNMTQSLKAIEGLMKLREEDDFFKKNNILFNIGRYDKFSKYNIKNVSRYMREKKDVYAVSYNTLFFEACAEGKIAEFFLRLRRVEPDDRNAIFINEISRFAKDLIYKIQELKIKL